MGSAWTSCLYGAVSGPSPEVADGLLSIPSAHAPGRASSPTVGSSPGAWRELWSAAICPFQGPEPPVAPRAGPCAPGRQHGPERGARPQAGLAAETQLPGAAGGPAAALQRLQVPGTVSDSWWRSSEPTCLQSSPSGPRPPGGIAPAEGSGPTQGGDARVTAGMKPAMQAAAFRVCPREKAFLFVLIPVGATVLRGLDQSLCDYSVAVFFRCMYFHRTDNRSGRKWDRVL